MPVELGKHVRYTHPQDLVLVQALVYAKYHVRDPEVFYTARCSRDSVNTRGRQAARCGFSMPSASYRVMFKKMGEVDITGFEHVLITGGTGFIGSALGERLLQLGARVSVLSRDRKRAREHFAGRVSTLESLDEVDGEDAPRVIVNLAGKNLGEQRWNRDVKLQLIASRIDTTQQIVDYIARAASRPQLLISGSAVGYYGARGDELLSEDSAAGDEYQASLCQRWEHTALMAEQHGVRVCISRTGIVMGRGGALAGLAPMFRIGLGAVAGSGRQWISWIHMHDLLEIFLRFMRDGTLSGPFNNTAPTPVSNREFSKAIGRALHRPVLLRAPGWAMRLLYGELAHLYLTGQKVVPVRHLQAGFEYRYPDIDAAVQAALQNSDRQAALQ